MLSLAVGAVVKFNFSVSIITLYKNLVLSTELIM